MIRFTKQGQSISWLGFPWVFWKAERSIHGRTREAWGARGRCREWEQSLQAVLPAEGALCRRPGEMTPPLKSTGQCFGRTLLAKLNCLVLWKLLYSGLWRLNSALKESTQASTSMPWPCPIVCHNLSFLNYMWKYIYTAAVTMSKYFQKLLLCIS